MRPAAHETKTRSVSDVSRLAPPVDCCETGASPCAIDIVNVTAQSELASVVEEQLGTSRGQTEILIVAETSAETTLAGDSESVTRTDRLRVSVSTGTYSVSWDLADEETVTVTETVRVPVEPDPLREYGSLAALIVGLVGAVAVAGLHRTGRLALSEQLQARIEQEKTRESYAEWISVGRIPPVKNSERVASVETLVDLVDVAIDSDRRVIEDRDTGEFVVLDGETRYVCDPSTGVIHSDSGEQDPLSDTDEAVAASSPEGKDTDAGSPGSSDGETGDDSPG
jgi:hypothetical protein